LDKEAVRKKSPVSSMKLPLWRLGFLL